MTKILIFCSTILFLSCSPTKKSTLPVDLISKLEYTIFIDSTPHLEGYSKILSEIDSLGLVDVIGDLERIDSMIICEWIEPDSHYNLANWTSHCRNAFYFSMRNEFSETIFSLKLKKNRLFTDEDKYLFAFSNRDRPHINTDFSLYPEDKFIKNNVHVFAPFIKNSILNKNASKQDKAFLISTLWKAAWGDERTRNIIAKSVIEITKSDEYQNFDQSLSCRLMYLLGETKTEIAKDFFLENFEDINFKEVKVCMISSLRHKLSVNI